MNANITVDFSKKTGKRVMPLHGFNSGPMTKVFTYDARPLFVEGGFPYVRLHDSEYPYGSGEFIDIPCIFKNFDADENDPASYNFKLTDEYIHQCLLVGAKIIYRLGVSIEHAPVSRYLDPPKDYAKWARICEHIIRHYNEGWADGFRWNIEYWEIWNEADLDRDTDMKRCWSGTVEEFAEFYTVAARHLKSCFPHLMIGGCGFSSARNPFIEGFLRIISEKSPAVPLDFYTWHRYQGSAAKYVEGAATVRNLLNEFGYGGVPSILDEWNLMYEWGPTEIQSRSYPAMKDERGASFYAGTLAALQEQTDVIMATNFEADVVKEFCGVFDVDMMSIGGLRKPLHLATLKPTKGFYAFKSFNSLYRMGEQVALSCDTEEIYATAASGDDGVGVLVSNPGDVPAEVTLDLAGVTTPIVLRLTDKDHTNAKVLGLSAGNTLTLTIPLSEHAFVYVGTDLPDPVKAYDPGDRL